MFDAVKQCDFDVSMCAILCPIGYMLDDSGCPKSCICGKTGYIQGDIAFSSKDIPSILKVRYVHCILSSVHFWQSYYAKKLSEFGVSYILFNC